MLGYRVVERRRIRRRRRVRASLHGDDVAAKVTLAVCDEMGECLSSIV